MQLRTGLSLLAVAALAPYALANGGNDDLDKISLPALQGSATVTFKPGQGFTVDGGDDYRMNVYNEAQIGWRYSNLDMTQDVMSFRVRRARTRLSGHVYSPATRFMVMVEWGSNAGNVLDAYAEQDLWENEEMSIIGRAGAMKTLFGREATGRAARLMFTERSIATRTLAGDDNRVVGGLAQLRAMDNHLFVHAGLFNGGTAPGSVFTAGHLAENGDNEVNYTVGGRYEFGEDQGDLEFAQGDLARSEEMQASVFANIWIGNERGTIGGQSGDVDVFSYNVGGNVKTGGISAMAEYFGWNGDPDFTGNTTDQDADGFNAQVTYTTESNWGFGGRVSMVSIDNPAAVGASNVNLMAPASTGTGGAGTALAGKGDVLEFTLGVSRFWTGGHHQKIQADITFQSVEPDSGTDQDNIIFRLLATIGI